MIVTYKKTTSTAITPRYATPGSSGMDLHADLSAPCTIDPGRRACISTGIAISLPSGCVGQVCPRSGLAKNHGLTVLNAPGLIDSDYRGVISVVLVNLGQFPKTINPGDRIAQLIVVETYYVQFMAVKELDEADRGYGGFGSTGDGS